MLDREAILPLGVGVLVAVLVHLLLLPVATSSPKSWSFRLPSRPRVDDLERVIPQTPHMMVGKQTNRPSAVAWIAYDNFQQLIAPQGLTEQPALQQQVDPQPNADTPLDPTPPGPAPVQLVAETTPSAAETESLAGKPVAGTEQQPLPSPPTAQTGDVLALAHPADKQKPGPEAALHRDNEHIQPDPLRQPIAALTAANPTAAARADSESPPFKLFSNRIKLVPGSVLTADGIEIKTALPRPSLVVQITIIPRNAKATLLFEPNGRVIKVTLTKSTGSAGWDGPVEASLYKWRAAGPKLAELNRPFTLDVEITWREEPKKEEKKVEEGNEEKQQEKDKDDKE